MNIKHFIAGVSALAVFCSGVSLPAAGESGLSDSGIDFTESVGTINNPAAGYTTTVWSVCKPGNTPVHSPSGNIVLFFIDIGAFSSGANGTKSEDGKYIPGKDYDLDESFFAAWDTTLKNCRDNGCMAALRFRYDAEGHDDPEPASFEQVLAHVQQIKDSGLLTKYSDILAYVECGFVGKWGEQHGGKYVSQDYKAQLLAAMLDAVPDPIPVTVRTPDIFAKWAGIERSQLNDRELINNLTSSDYCSDIQAYKDRIGLYNDGYMGSDYDLGTYADREKETDWLSVQALTSYYGGEFSGNLEYAMKYDTYLPENAIPEMYKTHLSYINGNIFQLYKNYTFGADCDVEGVDNSAYYGQNVFQFIRDHLGYRYVLRKSEITRETVQGGEVQVNFEVENTGFAGLIPPAQSYIVLEKDGVYTTAAADIDCRKWLSCTKSSETVSFRIPDILPAGDWNVSLKLSVGTPADQRRMDVRSIRFANNDIWRPDSGSNYLGTVTVTESAEKGTDNSFRLTGSDNTSPAMFYTGSGRTVADGVMTSPFEWNDDMNVGEIDRGEKLRIKADDRYLYFMSDIPVNGSAAPVYNLQLKNEENGESYWIYFASNGFVYFNHGDYMGSQCRWSDEIVEFRIPFEVMGLAPGTVISGLRIFMQDSGNDWKLISDVRGEKTEVPSDLCVISARTDVRLSAGEDLTYTVLADTDSELTYQWSFNGEPISGAVSDTLSLTGVTAESAGEYTVTLTTASGIVKNVTAFVLDIAEEVPDDTEPAVTVRGDVNGDGKVTAADAAAVLQYLANGDRYPLTEDGSRNADVDGDPGITVKDAMFILK